MPREQRLISISRSGLAGTVGVVIVMLVCIRLGFWQLDRLEQKRARNDALQARQAAPPVHIGSVARDTAGLMFRRALVTGVYDDARSVVVAGRSNRGVPGVYILTPVRTGGSAVLVNRGFMPSADAARVDLDSLRESAPDDAEGIIVYLGNDERGSAPDTTGFRTVWYRPSIAQLRTQFPYPLADYVVQLLPSDDAPQFPLRLAAPELDEGPHLGYAIQWFSFAAIFAIGWLALVLRARRQRPV